MKSYTYLRQQREEFRKRLVELLCCTKEELEMGDTEAGISAKEREILKYYYYIHHGIDTIHVSPMDDKVLNRVNIINIYKL